MDKLCVFDFVDFGEQEQRDLEQRGLRWLVVNEYGPAGGCWEIALVGPEQALRDWAAANGYDWPGC